jgi:hypothetical protein
MEALRYFGLITVLLLSIVGNQFAFFTATHSFTSIFLTFSSWLLMTLSYFGVYFCQNRAAIKQVDPRDFMLIPLAVVTEATPAFNHSFLFGLGCLQAVSSSLMIIGGTHTAGIIQTILYQLIIPLNMLFSLVIVRSRYNMGQVLGVLVLLGGILAVIWPSFTQPDAFAGNQVTSNLIYVLSLIPSSVSNVLSEKGLQHMRVNLWGLAAFSCFYQLPFLLVMLPLYNWKALMGTDTLPLSEIPSFLLDGLECVAGRGDGCKYAWAALVGCVVSNLTMSISALFIVKDYSATTSAIVAALSIPILTVIFNFLSPDPNWGVMLWVGAYIHTHTYSYTYTYILQGAL